LTPETLLRCMECERMFVFSELVNRIALEAYDPVAALETDCVARELIDCEIHVTGVSVVDANDHEMNE
jgi:hypothetical protein